MVVLLKGVMANGEESEGREVWRCPHGYDTYACNTGCPLYYQCMGSGEESFIPRIDESDGRYDIDTLPAACNEDGDWRTIYMDDTRYDDREEDEWCDDDRSENGW